MINIILENKLLDKKAAIYSIYYLLERYNLDLAISNAHREGCVNIYYGKQPDTTGCIYIPHEVYNIPKVFYNNFNNEDFISFNGLVEVPYKMKDNNMVFQFDIINSALYLITCREEQEISSRDSMERFSADYSLRKRKINRAYFDAYSSIIFKAMEHIDKTLKYQKNGFEIMLTHDVDNVNSRNKYIFLHNVKDMLLNKKVPFLEGMKKTVSYIASNKYQQVENCIKLEEKYNAKSEFYFLQGKPHRFGRRYKLSEAKKELDIFKKHKEFVIGIHTNFFSYDCSDDINEEINTIERFTGEKIVSNRNHYLRFKTPRTWEQLSEAGIRFDTTLGYSDLNGFRAATSHSFIPFNIFSGKLIDIYEVPLVVMDVVAMERGAAYFEEKWTEIKIVIDEVIKYGGASSILWHQCVLAEKDYRDMYERVIKYVSDNNGKFITHRDLVERKNKQKRQIEELWDNL